MGKQHDRHAGFKVRLPASFRGPLRELARRNRRYMSVELCLALAEHLRRHHTPPPPVPHWEPLKDRGGSSCPSASASGSRAAPTEGT